jgi:CheY-like chemotaxis protein
MGRRSARHPKRMMPGAERGLTMAAMSRRVLIVDDQPTFRQVARELLEHRGYVVVGEADDAATALAAGARLAPDAVLLDVCLGVDSGLDVAYEMTHRSPAPAVLLVSNAELGAELVERSGACGFVLKSRLARIDLAEYW